MNSKRLILMKEGEYRANVFTDLVEAVNNMETSELDREKLNFFARSDFSLRVHANFANIPGGPIAITHYNVDPYNEEQDPHTYRPINIELMMEALEHHPFVLFGLISETYQIVDYGAVQRGIYIVRTDDGHLIDYETKERIISNEEMENKSSVLKHAVIFLGLVKAGDLPIYYFITDPSIVRLGDGFDFLDESTGVVFRKISDHDGTIKENVFVPKVSKEATIVGKNHIFTQKDSVTISFFDDGILHTNNLTKTLPKLDISVDTNLHYRIRNNRITITFNEEDPDVGYVKIKFNLGHFFNVAQRKEAPVFEYIIHRS